MREPYIAATISDGHWPGTYHLAGGTDQDEFYFEGKLELIEAFALDLLEQIKTLRSDAQARGL